jgi:uncharacterized protein YdeI (BOF family)
MLVKLRKRFISRAVAASLAASLVALINVAAQHANRAPASPARNKTISIGAARALPPGTVVMVEGSVSVPSGAFRSGGSDEGFAIQDESGGIYVRTTPHLGLIGARRVRVRGQLADKSGQLILVPDDPRNVQVLGRALTVRPEPVSTGHINEATEGRLVRVRGTITKPLDDELPHGHRMFIDDGSGEVQVYVYASTGFPVRHLQPGQRVSVTGLSGQHDDHYRIMPRARSDIYLIDARSP